MSNQEPVGKFKFGGNSSEVPHLLRHLRILTQGAPYHRIARLIEIVQKEREENLLKIDRFPLNNRGSRNPVKVEREFT